MGLTAFNRHRREHGTDTDTGKALAVAQAAYDSAEVAVKNLKAQLATAEAHQATMKKELQVAKTANTKAKPKATKKKVAKKAAAKG